jgi:3-oxoacyl-[acyl-carrier protein] reductase
VGPRVLISGNWLLVHWRGGNRDGAAARELAPHNIRVNAVAPGLIDTKMTNGIPEEARKQLIERIGLGRAGSTAEVADAVLFLASDLARYITGQVIGVDGGMVL